MPWMISPRHGKRPFVRTSLNHIGYQHKCEKKVKNSKRGVFPVAFPNYSEHLCSSVVVLQYVPTLNLVNKPHATPEWFLYRTGVVVFSG